MQRLRLKSMIGIIPLSSAGIVGESLLDNAVRRRVATFLRGPLACCLARLIIPCLIAPRTVLSPAIALLVRIRYPIDNKSEGISKQVLAASSALGDMNALRYHRR